MALLDRVKERTATDLSDTELTAMIDAISSVIDARFGPAGEVEETIGDAAENFRWRRTLTLARPLDAAQTVVIIEMEPGDSGAVSANVELDPTDYRVMHGGRTLQRLTGGPHGNMFWAPYVSVTYTPVGEQAARDEVVIKIMQLDLSYRGGLKSERAGDYQFTLGSDPADEREKLLASLASGRGMVMA